MLTAFALDFLLTWYIIIQINKLMQYFYLEDYSCELVLMYLLL